MNLEESINNFLQDDTKCIIFYEHNDQHITSWWSMSVKLKETGLNYKVYIYDGGAQKVILGKLHGFDKVVILTDVHEEWMNNYLFLNVYTNE